MRDLPGVAVRISEVSGVPAPEHGLRFFQDSDAFAAEIVEEGIDLCWRGEGYGQREAAVGERLHRRVDCGVVVRQCLARV